MALQCIGLTALLETAGSNLDAYVGGVGVVVVFDLYSHVKSNPHHISSSSS